MHFLIQVKLIIWPYILTTIHSQPKYLSFSTALFLIILARRIIDRATQKPNYISYTTSSSLQVTLWKGRKVGFIQQILN